MAETPYELQKLVTVATFTFPWEAQVAQARLAAFDIASFIADEHAIRMVALSYALGGIQVQVSEADAAAARDVLQHGAPLPEIYLVKTADTAGEEEEARETAADTEPLVTVARFYHPWDAHLARTLLESEGIACCVFEDRVPLLNLMSGAPLALNRLEVHHYDAERATALLARAAVSEEGDAEAGDLDDTGD